MCYVDWFFTVVDDVPVGKRDASMEDVIAAAKLANIHHVIDSLPEKYNTKLGTRGAMLSGGQVAIGNICRWYDDATATATATAT